ncbi:MAG: alpha/beta fold hydrolase [Ornithinimicrobium sp.]
MDPTALMNELLSATTWTALDIDDEGRVLAGHDALGTLQLVEIAPDRATTPLTDLPNRCSGRYIPGRRQVIVQHDQGGDERMQLSLLDLDPLPANPAGLDALTPLVHDPAYMHDLRDLSTGTVVYSTNRRNGVDMDVVVRDLDTGTEQVAYDEGGYVVGAALNPSEDRLAVLRLSQQPHSTVLDLVRINHGGTDQDTAVTDPLDHALHDLPSWTDDDATWVLSSNHHRDFAAIQRLNLADRTCEIVLADDSHDLACWVSPDGASILVATLDDGAYTLALHGIDGTPRCTVDIPPLAMLTAHWSPSAQRLAISGSTPIEPGAIYSVNVSTGAADLLASSADALAPDVRARLTEPTTHRIPARDDEQIPCFMYAGTPVGHGATEDGEVANAGDVADERVSGASVVHIHGGPEGASLRSWHPVIQALAASGFTVLVPNVRGSTGYGKRWYTLDDVELRLDSVADLADLHTWLPTQGLDPARAALWGGSYGGYMVLAGVSMQPHLWAAGVDIVGMSSLVTFLENTSAYRRAYREREYGSLEHHRALLERASPITYLDQIVAPLFVIHGANDPRVPLTEAQQIKAALSDQGVSCEMRVYNDEGHGLAKRANKLDAYPAAIAFLNLHLG